MGRWKTGQDKCCDEGKDLRSQHCGISVSSVPRPGTVLALVQPSPSRGCPVRCSEEFGVSLFTCPGTVGDVTAAGRSRVS